MAVYFYASDSSDGWRNLALDGFFLQNLKKEDIIFYLYVNANAVIIGKNQNAWRECNLDAMEKDGVQLVRRHTGGGAVFHDRGNLNFSFVMREEAYDLTRQFGVIQRAVAQFGLQAELSGRNDILIDGKKFSGNAFAASRGMRAHHGTILVNTDLSKLAGYLNVSEKKMSAKGIRSVRSRVCNLGELNAKLTVPAMTQALKEAFRAEYGAFAEYPFREEDREKIDALYATQASWEWRFGNPISFDYQIEERYSFGEMQLLFRVKAGEITEVSVYSDALDTELSDQVRDRLAGVRFTPGEIADRLCEGEARDEFREIGEHIRGIVF